MNGQKLERIGIGFATGRKSFQQVLKTYAYSWMESGMTQKSFSINVLVAYDLKYRNTERVDYTNVSKPVADLIDDICFIGNTAMQDEINQLIRCGVTDEAGAKLLFGSGYAGKRNTVLYMAIKHGIDYLLFLDDDEYPLAATRKHSKVIWSGQSVLDTHLRNISNADMTHGYHCGYISPIPQIDFNEALGEEDLRVFIEAISNDILSWDNIRRVMDDGGVTYADTDVLTSEGAIEVQQHNGAKFISGANLCINLTDPSRAFAFYNPPGARGEDTFMSTLLSDRKVMRVPCYTFHDGFSTYQHIMDGVLPTRLRAIRADTDAVISRFYHACVGWVRYKPLLLYITQRDDYDKKIREMREKLAATLPKVSAYFNSNAFMGIEQELEHYHRNVKKHFDQFEKAQRTWSDVRDYLCSVRGQAEFLTDSTPLKGDVFEQFTGI